MEVSSTGLCRLPVCRAEPGSPLGKCPPVRTSGGPSAHSPQCRRSARAAARHWGDPRRHDCEQIAGLSGLANTLICPAGRQQRGAGKHDKSLALPERSRVKIGGAGGSLTVSRASAFPASFSTEMLRRLPGCCSLQRKSIRSGETASTGVALPFTITRAPASSVESPPGSLAVAWPADSQLRVRVAGAPGLQPVESWPAAFRTPLIKVFPEPTSMSMWPVADAADELVAVKATYPSVQPAKRPESSQSGPPRSRNSLLSEGRRP